MESHWVCHIFIFVNLYISRWTLQDQDMFFIFPKVWVMGQVGFLKGLIQLLYVFIYNINKNIIIEKF